MFCIHQLFYSHQSAIAQPTEMSMFYIHQLFYSLKQSASILPRRFSICSLFVISCCSMNFLFEIQYSIAWFALLSCFISFSLSLFFIPCSSYILLWKWILLKDPSKDLFNPFHWLDRGNLKLVNMCPCSQVRGAIFGKFNIIQFDNEGDELFQPFKTDSSRETKKKRQ